MRRHTLRSKFAFYSFLIIAVAEIAVGLRYLLSPRIMSYHQQALGVSWSDLAPREQMVLIALLRGTGLCALITGMTLTTLLLIPFRRGEPWARWAIAGLSLFTLVPATWEAVTLAAATGATTPWPFLLAAILLVLVAFSRAGPINTHPELAPALGAQPLPLGIARRLRYHPGTASRLPGEQREVGPSREIEGASFARTLASGPHWRLAR
jgi:hypothetical protein